MNLREEFINTNNYRLLGEEDIPFCCGSCRFIRYHDLESPTCKILPGNVCVFGFCDGYIKSKFIYIGVK